MQAAALHADDERVRVRQQDDEVEGYRVDAAMRALFEPITKQP